MPPLVRSSNLWVELYGVFPDGLSDSCQSFFFIAMLYTIYFIRKLDVIRYIRHTCEVDTVVETGLSAV